MTPLCACGQPAPSSVICGACERKLADALAEVPGLAVELEVALARQAVFGGGTPGRGHAAPLPYDERASEGLQQLRAVLSGWVRVIAEAGTDGWPADTLPSMALWLAANMSRVRQHEAAGDIVYEVTAARDCAKHVIDLPRQRVYAGPCDPPCTGELLSEPGRTLAHCDVCGTAYGIAERQEWMRARLGDYLATSTEAELMLGGIGIHVTAGTIRMWHHRSRLEPRFGAEGVTRPRYRLGDVIGLALARDTARAGLVMAA